MEWGRYNNLSLFYPTRMFSIKRSKSHLAVGLHFNGYKLTRKTRNTRIIGWRTKLIHSAKRFAELLDDLGLNGLYNFLSNRYEKKDSRNNFNQHIKSLQKNINSIHPYYADKIQYTDLNTYNNNNTHYKEELEILLEQKNNLQITGENKEKNLYEQKIQQKINALRVKSICSYLSNQSFSDYKEKKLYIYSENIGDDVTGYVITQKIQVGKIVFSIKRFDNKNNEQNIVLENIGNIIVPLAKKNKKYLQQNFHKTIAVQLANPDFIKFLHDSFYERNKNNQNENLDLDNETDFFYYLAAYNMIDSIESKSSNKDSNKYKYLLVDEKNIQKNINIIK